MRRRRYFTREQITIDSIVGELTILSIGYKTLLSGQRKSLVIARCSCGGNVETLLDNVVISPHPMCKDCLTLSKRTCQIGDRFDKLKVVGFVYSENTSPKLRALCRCDCGNEKSIRPDSLKKNKSNNCGCVLGPNWQGCGELSMTYYNHLKRNAERRELQFIIPIEYLWNLFEKQGSTCALTGVPITLGRIFCKEQQSASLDRIDSNKGYIKDNVWWVHKDINALKNDFSLARFRELCRMVAVYNKDL